MFWPFAISPPLPNNILKTTFVQQAPERNWQQPWQDACEEAALLTVVYFKQAQAPQQQKIIKDLKELINYENLLGLPYDINVYQMGKVSQKIYGYDFKIIQDPSIETLKNEIQNQRPVIVPVNGKILYQENKNFKNGGPLYHNIVILGFDDRQKVFIVHDVGTRKGEYFRYSYQTLMEAIHDLPKSGDKHEINKGEKTVLVLL